MKLIIDIPNYNNLNDIQNGSIACSQVLKAVKSGTPYEERPQGEWIRTGSLGNGNAQYECSNCHYGDEHAESQEVPYCWHCGADMRNKEVHNDS